MSFVCKTILKNTGKSFPCNIFLQFVFSRIVLLGLFGSLLGSLFGPNALLPAQQPRAVPPKLLGSEESSVGPLSIYEWIRNLNHPWSAAWVPQNIAGSKNYAMLISERNGAVWRFEEQPGQLSRVQNLPADVLQRGQGGYLGLYYHRRLRRVYLAYSQKMGQTQSTLRLISFILNGSAAADIREEFAAALPLAAARHYGGVIAGSESAIYLSLGERGQRNEAQNPNSDWGSIFAAQAESPAAKLKFTRLSMGHRNALGLFYDVRFGQLWAIEHGPQGGDELNRIERGKNYGWPIISYGREYGSGKKIGVGASKSGLEQPIRYWTPSPAPGNMIILGAGPESDFANRFPAWRGDFLIPMLKAQKLIRLRLSAQELNGEQNGRMVADQETLFSGRFGRLRWVGLGPDGALYLLNDAKQGKLFQIVPAQ